MRKFLIAGLKVMYKRFEVRKSDVVEYAHWSSYFNDLLHKHSYSVLYIGIPISDQVVYGIPNSDPRLFGIPDSNPPISGILSLDFMIPE